MKIHLAVQIRRDRETVSAGLKRNGFQFCLKGDADRKEVRRAPLRVLTATLPPTFLPHGQHHSSH